MTSRVSRLYRNLDDGLDLIVFANSTEPHIDLSFMYATGLSDGLFEGCAAFCYPNGGVEIMTSALEEQTATHANLPLHAFRTREEREGILRRLLKGHRRIGLNDAEITHRAAQELRKFAPKATFVDVSEAVMHTRLVKDEREIALLRKAATIASDALALVMPDVGPGDVESEIAARLVYAMQEEGASGASFHTIVGSGPNSAEPHYTAGPRRLRKGDLVVIDFGAKYKLYCSDVTRTFVVGRPSDRQREIHDTVRRAQLAAMRMMRPGVKAKKVDTAARTLIDASAYKGRFIHGLGHSVGLAVHDGGGLNQASDLVLRKNMVFTNEPGIYVPGFGGVRIEDDVLITGGSPKLLSTAPRELIEV